MEQSRSTIFRFDKMKFLLSTSLSLVAVSNVESWKVHKLEHENERKLSQFDFLISRASPQGQPFCMTAADTDGMRSSNLKLKPCDFEQYPAEQLWNYADDKFYNDVGNGNSKCMMPNDLLEGARMRLAADCNVNVAHDEFIYDGEYIKLKSNENYCVTNRGQNVNDNDSIHLKPCRDRDDFKWLHTGNDPRGTLYSFYAEGGCIQTNNDSIEKFTKVIIGECSASSAWSVFEANGGKMFRSGLDTSMCLQAGLGGVVKHGTMLRLMPCDENEELQKFEWDDETPIKLVSIDNLCLEWRGLNVNVGTDPIVMKSCEHLVFEGWSGDEVN
jgi:hypothetical protein